MTRPSPSPVHDRYAARIIDQTARLTSAVEGADATASVPGCPGWPLAHLLRHVGGAHRWAETVVRTRAAEPVSDEQVNDVTPDADDDLAALADWLTEGAALLADTLRATGPEVPVWTVAPGGTPHFWARRMTYETVVHRFDATAAVGETVHPRRGRRARRPRRVGRVQRPAAGLRVGFSAARSARRRPHPPHPCHRRPRGDGGVADRPHGRTHHMEPHAQEVDRHGTRPAHGSPAPPVPAPLAGPRRGR